MGKDLNSIYSHSKKDRLERLQTPCLPPSQQAALMVTRSMLQFQESHEKKIQLKKRGLFF